MTHDSLRRAFGRAAYALLLLLAGAGPAVASPAAGGRVRGRVLDPDGNGLPGAAVVLANEVTGYRQQTFSGTDGSFLLYNVPENPYRLSVSIAGFAPAHGDLDVRGNVPLVREFRLRLSAADATTVTAAKEAVALETDSVSTHVDIDKSLVRRAAAPLASRALEALVTSAPGFAQDENGRYHFQGGHSQQLLVVDGQPIGDQIGITFSNSLNPAIAENLSIVTGGIAAEYGEKANGVIDVTTRSGLGTGFKGEVGGGAARFRTWEGLAALGGGSSRFGWFASFDASGSGRFLDPVSFEGFHDDGRSQRGFLRLDTITASGRDSFRLTANAGRTDRDVTNLPSQEDAGQDQTVLSQDWNANLGWQEIVSGDSVLEAQVYARDARLTLYGSPNDTPVRADQNRSLENQGVNLAFSKQVGRHELKIGIQGKRYPIRETFSFGITDPAFDDPGSEEYNPGLAPFDLTRGGSPFRFSDARTASYSAAFAQDTWRLDPLTVAVGLRYDRNRLFRTETQLSPRLGVAYAIAATRTVLRASYDRMFLTPAYENILTSSSPEARSLVPPEIRDAQELGFGQLTNASEKHDVLNAGLQQGIGSKLRLDLSWWYRSVENAADQGQFFNTGIVFPLNFQGGQLRGWNARLDLAPTGGLSGYVSVGHVRAKYRGPFVGGLFLDAEALDSLGGGYFVIDHDQDLQEQAGVFYDVAETGFWAGVTQRYDSGLVADAGTPEDVLSSPDTAYADPFLRYGEDPQRVTSRTIWNASVGARLQKYGVPFELQLDVLNVFDRAGLYNFRSVFGGTHVIPPRTVSGRVRFVF